MRLSPTIFESFRLLRTQDWMTTDRIIEELTEPWRDTPAMRRGRAVHKWLELAGQGIPPPRSLGIRFECDADLLKPFGFESRLERPMPWGTLVGVADALAHDTPGSKMWIVEYKTSTRESDPEKFIESRQAVALLALWPYAVGVRYEVFRIASAKGPIIVTDHASIELQRPPHVLETLAEDAEEIRRLVNQWDADGLLPAGIDPKTGMPRKLEE